VKWYIHGKLLEQFQDYRRVSENFYSSSVTCAYQRAGTCSRSRVPGGFSELVRYFIGARRNFISIFFHQKVKKNFLPDVVERFPALTCLTQDDPKLISFIRYMTTRTGV
jgi:hypothetical protein